MYNKKHSSAFDPSQARGPPDMLACLGYGQDWRENLFLWCGRKPELPVETHVDHSKAKQMYLCKAWFTLHLWSDSILIWMRPESHLNVTCTVHTSLTSVICEYWQEYVFAVLEVTNAMLSLWCTRLYAPVTAKLCGWWDIWWDICDLYLIYSKTGIDHNTYSYKSQKTNDTNHICHAPLVVGSDR